MLVYRERLHLHLLIMWMEIKDSFNVDLNISFFLLNIVIASVTTVELNCITLK